jgi:uncharacterized membrane protein
VRHRRHQQPARSRRFQVSYDDVEAATVAEAAASAGLTPTGFIAAAALAVARDVRPPVGSLAREALAELSWLSTQLRRLGVNVNQAVARFHTTGAAPPQLEAAVRVAIRVAERVEDAADRTVRLLP